MDLQPHAEVSLCLSKPFVLILFKRLQHSGLTLDSERPGALWQSWGHWATSSFRRPRVNVFMLLSETSLQNVLFFNSKVSMFLAFSYQGIMQFKIAYLKTSLKSKIVTYAKEEKWRRFCQFFSYSARKTDSQGKCYSVYMNTDGHRLVSGRPMLSILLQNHDLF